MNNDIKRRLLAPVGSFNYGVGIIFLLFSMVTHRGGSIKHVLSTVGLVFIIIGLVITILRIRLKNNDL